MVANAGSLVLSGGTYTWTATPTADARVDQTATDTNYGTENRLETVPPSRLADANPDEHGQKSYIRFDLPSSSFLTAANVVAASLKLTAEADANTGYHDMNTKQIRLWALREYYDTWAEDTITYKKGLQSYGSVSGHAPSDKAKYFIYTSADLDPNYPYPVNEPIDPNDPNGPKKGYPTMEIMQGYWVNEAKMNTVRSVTWDLLHTNSADANGAYTNAVITAGDEWDGNDSIANFLDLVGLDTNDSISLMLGANHMTYYQSREAASAGDKPTLVIQFVPEPATLTVLSLGALGLLRRRRS